jgi:hypothetical protein
VYLLGTKYVAPDDLPFIRVRLIWSGLTGRWFFCGLAANDLNASNTWPNDCAGFSFSTPDSETVPYATTRSGSAQSRTATTMTLVDGDEVTFHFQIESATTARYKWINHTQGTSGTAALTPANMPTSTTPMGWILGVVDTVGVGGSGIKIGWTSVEIGTLVRT